jgi:hypothetical protein
MEEFKLEAVVEHVKRLERSLARVRLGLSVLGITTAALIGFIGVLLSQHSSSLRPSPDHTRVSAREFIVTDENENPVAWFGSLKDGAALFLAAHADTTEKSKPPSYVADLLAAIWRSGGSFFIAGGDRTELSLRDRLDAANKADDISLTVNSTSPGFHESALRSSGRDGMSAFSGLKGREQSFRRMRRLAYSPRKTRPAVCKI